jgi:hypothetical protein
MKIKQADLRRRGDRIERIMNSYYNADRLRADTGLDEKIKNLEGAIAMLEEEADRLKRQITAEEEVPGGDAKKIAHWMNVLVDKDLRIRAAKLELERFVYLRILREQKIAEMTRAARE